MNVWVSQFLKSIKKIENVFKCLCFAFYPDYVDSKLGTPKYPNPEDRLRRVQMIRDIFKKLWKEFEEWCALVNEEIEYQAWLKKNMNKSNNED